MQERKSWRQNNLSKHSHGVSTKKAKKIIKHGKVRGKPLTKKQKGFFGARAGGMKRKRTHRRRRRRRTRKRRRKIRHSIKKRKRRK